MYHFLLFVSWLYYMFKGVQIIILREKLYDLFFLYMEIAEWQDFILSTLLAQM
jgi:hypothetical protein